MKSDYSIKYQYRIGRFLIHCITNFSYKSIPLYEHREALRIVSKNKQHMDPHLLRKFELIESQINAEKTWILNRIDVCSKPDKFKSNM